MINKNEEWLSGNAWTNRNDRMRIGNDERHKKTSYFMLGLTQSPLSRGKPPPKASPSISSCQQKTGPPLSLMTGKAYHTGSAGGCNIAQGVRRNEGERIHGEIWF
jgi:hypothetical protein